MDENTNQTHCQLWVSYLKPEIKPHLDVLLSRAHEPPFIRVQEGTLARVSLDPEVDVGALVSGAAGKSLPP